MVRPISFTLNGRPVRLSVDDERMLLWVLRHDLRLTGTRFGCGAALCGACTVLVDDAAVRSCMTPVGDVEGRRVLTIEGLGRDGGLHPLQRAFHDGHAFQCGFCTSGMILGAHALLLRHPHPTRAEIVEHLDGNLCRCGSHLRILEAIEAVASGKGGER
jgi:aerobic-type carbon monoxide dehydrogenase small subunit (CoxS/CutS family)